MESPSRFRSSSSAPREYEPTNHDSDHDASTKTEMELDQEEEDGPTLISQTALLILPDEVLSHITRSLPPPSQRLLQLTCQKLSHIARRELWYHLEFKSSQSEAILRTLAASQSLIPLIHELQITLELALPSYTSWVSGILAFCSHVSNLHLNGGNKECYMSPDLCRSLNGLKELKILRLSDMGTFEVVGFTFQGGGRLEKLQLGGNTSVKPFLGVKGLRSFSWSYSSPQDGMQQSSDASRIAEGNWETLESLVLTCYNVEQINQMFTGDGEPPYPLPVKLLKLRLIIRTETPFDGFIKFLNLIAPTLENFSLIAFGRPSLTLPADLKFPAVRKLTLSFKQLNPTTKLFGKKDLLLHVSALLPHFPNLQRLVLTEWGTLPPPAVLSALVKDEPEKFIVEHSALFCLFEVGRLRKLNVIRVKGLEWVRGKGKDDRFELLG